MIGNGMAGIRTIEEIINRDANRYDITVIGKEPYLTITASCYLIFYE